MNFLRPKIRSATTAPASSDAERRAHALAAYENEYRRFYKSGLRFALSQLDDEQDAAEDAVQRALIALWEVGYADGDVPQEPVETLFFQILRRKIYDVWREADRRAPYDEQHAIDISGYLASATDTRLVAEGALLDSRLAYAVAALPEKMRLAVEAYVRTGDKRTIAAELGEPPANAKWNLGQGLARLRTQLDRDGYSPPAPVPRGRSGGRKR